jgi:Carboxypeptidase regulatory-like domain
LEPLTVRIQAFSLLIVAVALAVPAVAQDISAPRAGSGQITGTVTDDNGDTLSGAKLTLRGPGPADHIELLSDDNGFFDFKRLAPGTYHLIISGEGFSGWTSPDLVLSPGQYMILPDCKLRVASVATTVNVAYRPDQIATEQVQVEETQRVFGVIPNFYVVYDSNPAPLTAKLKFHLALKTSTDVFTVLGVGAFAAINQAGDTPNYQQGAKGYGERVGAAAADGLSDIMIGGAILPSLLHQDPRYHFKGTGSNKSRVLHAISSPFICKGDNGKSQFNLSSIGGDLGSSALSNLYYPQSNRGAGLVFQNFTLTTGERMLSSLVQEFVLDRFMPKQRLKE